jgi:hypothetical protein
MKTIFNDIDKNEIIQRIEKLTPESKALWGKMNVGQMLAHCAEAAKLPIREVKTAFSPIQILGQFFKKSFIQEGKPFRKNSPTAPDLRMVDEKDFSKEKANFIAVLNKINADGEKGITQARHPFFGKMSVEDWGMIGYKHADHHLSQFGV